MPLLKNTITNIRYAHYRDNDTEHWVQNGRVLFDWNGHALAIREPTDGTILVGTDPVAAAKWIADRYGMFLAELSPVLSGKIVEVPEIVERQDI